MGAVHSLCERLEAGIEGMLSVPKSYQAPNRPRGQDRGDAGRPSVAPVRSDLLGLPE